MIRIDDLQKNCLKSSKIKEKEAGMEDEKRGRILNREAGLSFGENDFDPATRLKKTHFYDP